MADSAQVKRLRLMVDEPDTTKFTNEDIADFIDQADGDFNVAAQQIWEMKAAALSTMVNTSESGSSRSNSDLYKNAAAQAKYFSDKLGVATPSPTAGRPRVKQIKRV